MANRWEISKLSDGELEKRLYEENVKVRLKAAKTGRIQHDTPELINLRKEWQHRTGYYQPISRLERQELMQGVNNAPWLLDVLPDGFQLGGLIDHLGFSKGFMGTLQKLEREVGTQLYGHVEGYPKHATVVPDIIFTSDLLTNGKISKIGENIKESKPMQKVAGLLRAGHMAGLRDFQREYGLSLITALYNRYEQGLRNYSNARYTMPPDQLAFAYHIEACLEAVEPDSGFLESLTEVSLALNEKLGLDSVDDATGGAGFPLPTESKVFNHLFVPFNKETSDSIRFVIPTTKIESTFRNTICSTTYERLEQFVQGQFSNRE